MVVGAIGLVYLATISFVDPQRACTRHDAVLLTFNALGWMVVAALLVASSRRTGRRVRLDLGAILLASLLVTAHAALVTRFSDQACRICVVLLVGEAVAITLLVGRGYRLEELRRLTGPALVGTATAGALVGAILVPLFFPGVGLLVRESDSNTPRAPEDRSERVAEPEPAPNDRRDGAAAPVLPTLYVVTRARCDRCKNFMERDYAGVVAGLEGVVNVILAREDTAEGSLLAQRFRVAGYPGLILVQGNMELMRIEGYIQAADLVRAIRRRLR